MRMLFSFAKIWLVILLTIGFLLAQTVQLESKKILEREIKGGETQTFSANLRQGDFAQFIVTQRGIDVLVRLSFNGKTIAERDAPNGTDGDEVLSYIAENTATYTLEIVPLDEKAAPGKYSLKLNSPHKPTANDLTRIKAENLMGDALQLRNKPETLTDSSQKFIEAAKLFGDLGEIYWQDLSAESLASVYSDLKEFDKALEIYQELLTRAETAKNEKRQAELLNFIGIVHFKTERFTKAIESQQKSLAIWQKLNDETQISTVLANIAFAHKSAKDYPNAIKTFRQLFDFQQKRSRNDNAINTLLWIAEIYNETKDYKNLIAVQTERLELTRQLKNPQGEATTLNDLAIGYENSGDKAKAKEFYLRALAIYRESHDGEGEVVILTNLANVADRETANNYRLQAIEIYKNLQNPAKAITVYKSVINSFVKPEERVRALPIYDELIKYLRAINDERNEAINLNRKGVLMSDLADKKKKEILKDLILPPSDVSNGAVECYEKALEIFKRLKDDEFVARVSLNFGVEFENTGEPQKALPFLENALGYWQKKGSDADIISTYRRLGDVYEDLKQNDKSLEYYQKGLDLALQKNLTDDEGNFRNSIGVVYQSQNEFKKALEQYAKAVDIFQQQKDRYGEMVALQNKAKMLHTLGSYDEAVRNYLNSGEIAKELGNSAYIISNLKYVAYMLPREDREKALGAYTLALEFARKKGNKQDEAALLNDIGILFATTTSSEDDLKKAQNYFEQSLTVGEAGANQSQINALEGIAIVAYLRNDYGTSYEYLQRALPLARSLNYFQIEAEVLGNMMTMLKYSGNERLAILYGKQAINLYQKLRANIKGLDKNIEGGFSKKNEDKYHTLADLLIKQGKIPEAEAVLAMLKENEYFEFVQRDGGEAKKLLANIELTPEETEAVARFDKISNELTSKGLEFEKLRTQIANTPAEKVALDKRRAELSADIEAATKTFGLISQQIQAEFAKAKASVNVATTLGGANDLQSKLRASKLPNTVIISTIVAEDNLYLILTTPSVKVVEKSVIKAEAVNQLTQEFRKALQNPAIDPRPAGQKLYEILFKPLEKHLAALEKNANGKPLTLVWSLDGSLRYIPIAALWNGNQYLAEKYQNVLFTLASRDQFGKSGTADWHGLGLGVSQAWGDFVALPSVKDELTQGAIRAENDTSSKGVVDGKVLIDRDFTEDAFSRELSGGDYSLIHIASHFSLKPGGYSKSFLLLGDGKPLSLDKIENSPDFVFDNVELLTLSACNTANGGTDANGKEIEGFAKLAQDKGAKAVMATLWSVADNSTREFMTQFYRLHKDQKLSKAEAMRQAQLALLNGKFQSQSGKTKRSDLAGEVSADANQILFKKDENRPFAHPFYWSPFVLIGNWR